MNEPASAPLTRALELTVGMLDAAAGDNWDRVSQLDAERQRSLRKCGAEPLGAGERQLVAALLKHNQTLLALAEGARAALHKQLDQHRYNHRALRTYIASSR
ncbi:MAG TPA: flagellar protein FliT [Dyella sp.]|uniref:flagellar protein FliT n=1 Tax=Dyella sp. TaxID=1869338 RepID=UPI002C55F05A|nr:flagellar protein FliT [Dyella sp.]HTV86120.1 flagellar protein FliT [Dyella sp.]